MATKNRQIQEVTEKVGTNHYEEEFLNNLGAPHGKDLLEDKKGAPYLYGHFVEAKWALSGMLKKTLRYWKGGKTK